MSMVFTAANAHGRIAFTDTDAWHHWAFVYDGGGAANADRLKIYLDAANQSLTFNGTIPASMGNATTGVVFTGFDDVNNVYLDGTVALRRIWTAALSAAEVAQEMHSYRPARTSGLILWSPYDDGTNARDYSGNGNHGTATGARQAQGPPVGYGGETMHRRDLFRLARRVGQPFHLIGGGR